MLRVKFQNFIFSTLKFKMSYCEKANCWQNFANRVCLNQLETLQFQQGLQLREFQLSYQDVSENHAKHLEDLLAKVQG